MDFQQSRTFANLQTAFDYELMATGRYQLYGDRARREGYIEISNVFNTVASQELAHAVIWLRQLNAGSLPTTQENLETALALEDYIGNNAYREYARVAREEGYDDIAALFNGVANIQLNYDLAFQNFLNDMITNQLFCKENEVLWICINCGNIMSGNCAPEICPVCFFPQGYYRVFNNTL